MAKKSSRIYQIESDFYYKDCTEYINGPFSSYELALRHYNMNMFAGAMKKYKREVESEWLPLRKIAGKSFSIKGDL